MVSAVGLFLVLLSISGCLAKDLAGETHFGAKAYFRARYYAYTAVGWNYTAIDKSILEENLRYVTSLDWSDYTWDIDYLVVFPEHTFTTTEVLHNRSLAVELAQRVPEPNEKPSPCVVNSPEEQDLVVAWMSCVSARYDSYTVVGILEKVPCVEGEECRADGLKIYSTTVVFDPKGIVIAKYRKFHLIDEPALDPAPTQEAITITLGGERFGLLTGNDLLFEEPTATLSKTASFFVYNGAWQSKLPFMFGTSVEQGWAQKNRGWMVAANYMRPELGYTGTGLFYKNGASDDDLQESSGGNENSSIWISGFDAVAIEKANKDKGTRAISIQSQNLEGWASVDVPAVNVTNGVVNVCHGTEFCCELTYSTNGTAANTFYKLIAFDGDRLDSMGNVVFPEQTCGLVACAGEDVTTCGADKNEVLYTKDILFTNIKISGSFSTNNTAPNSMLGGDSYSPIAALKFSSIAEGERFRTSYEFLGNTEPKLVHVFGLTSTDLSVV